MSRVGRRLVGDKKLWDGQVTFLAHKLCVFPDSGETHAVVSGRGLHPSLCQPSDIPLDVVFVLGPVDDPGILGGREERRPAPDGRALVPRLADLVGGDRRRAIHACVSEHEETQLRIVDERRVRNQGKVKLEQRGFFLADPEKGVVAHRPPPARAHERVPGRVQNRDHDRRGRQGPSPPEEHRQQGQAEDAGNS